MNQTQTKTFTMNESLDLDVRTMERDACLESGQMNHNKVASLILNENKILYCAGDYYRYEDGVYKYIGKEVIKKYIKEICREKFKTHLSEEIMYSLQTEAYIPLENLNLDERLNLKNGLFDINTYILTSHNPNVLSSIRLGVSYNPEAKCELWERSLQEIFENDIEKIELLQECFGLCFTKDISYQTALFLIGEGANGKSLILGTLQNILGRANYSAIPLEKFSDAHYISALFGKLANISIETNAKSEVYDSIFKAIVSGDAITTDPKYKDPFTFHPFCKLVFALNNMPRVDDKTDAFFRRLLIIRFNRQFATEEQNKNLSKELLAELDGIFLWSINGLKRLRERGYFKLPDKIKAEIDEYRRENNNIMVFIDEECKLDPQASLTKQSLYDAYSKWCKENGYKSVSKKRFGIELLRHYKAVKDLRTMSERSWEGIATRFIPKTTSF